MSTQIANHASVSIDTPSVVTLLEDVIDPSATISKREGLSNEDTVASPTTISEPIRRRLWRMNWQEKSVFPSK